MNVFPTFEPGTLSTVKLGSHAREPGTTDWLLVVESWVRDSIRSWIQFEGDDPEVWCAVDIDPLAPKETVLIVKDARLWLRFEKRGLGTCEDAAFADPCLY
jgi:hypothetical protein